MLRKHAKARGSTTVRFQSRACLKRGRALAMISPVAGGRTTRSRKKGAHVSNEESSESNPNGRVLSGKCECGAVRYRVEDAFLYAANCHCSNCRAATGSAFKAFAGIERDKLKLTDGLDSLLVFGEDDLNNTRCGVCGSLLFSVVRDGAYVHVALGSLVDAPSIRPTEHIFVGSKAPWFEITDDLPQSEEYD
jgi:hypothetical protein